MKKICVFTMILFPCCLCTGQAADYYVATNGNDGNPGTQSFPWKTFKKAFQSARAGDTVYFFAGNYTSTSAAPDIYEGMVRGGSSWSNATRFMAAPGVTQKPKWVMPYMPAGDLNYGFTFQGSTSRYIIIEGMEFDGGTDYNAQDLNGAHHVFKAGDGAGYIRWNNVEVYGAWHSNYQLPSDGAGHNEILNSRIHHAGGVTVGVGSPSHGPSTREQHHNLYISGNDNLVQNCTIYNTTGWNIHNYNDADINNRNNTYIGNFLYDGAQGGAIASSGRNHKFYNNVFWKNPGGGLNLGVSGCYGTIYVYHNTFVNTGNTNVEESLYVSPGTSWYNPQFEGGAYFVNNIFYNSGLTYSSSHPGTIYNNLFFGQSYTNSGNAQIKNNLVNANPLFVNLTSLNFKLQSVSPGINAGLNAGITIDHDGVVRPQGSGYDIGAYEYRLSVIYGDVSGDGRVSAYDAALAVQSTVGLITLTPEQITRGDVSGGGGVSAYDAALIAQYVVGLITKFPVEG